MAGASAPLPAHAGTPGSHTHPTPAPPASRPSRSADLHDGRGVAVGHDQVHDARGKGQGELAGEASKEPARSVEHGQRADALQMHRQAPGQQPAQLPEPDLEHGHVGAVAVAQPSPAHDQPQHAKRRRRVVHVAQNQARHKVHALRVPNPGVGAGVRLEHMVQRLLALRRRQPASEGGGVRTSECWVRDPVAAGHPPPVYPVYPSPPTPPPSLRPAHLQCPG